MTIETHCDPKSSSARNFDDLARARRSCAGARRSWHAMSTKLTHHIFLRLADPNKGPECCLGGAGHLLVAFFGVGGTPRGILCLAPFKLIFINLGGKNEIPLGVPPTPKKATSKCPAPPKQHSGPLFGPASLRKML